MCKAVFWDLQGTLVPDAGGPLTGHEEVYPFARDALGMTRRAGYLNIIVTNQSQIAKGQLTEEDYQRAEAAILAQLNRGGTLVDAVLHCPHGRWENCRCKKPRTGMLEACQARYGLDLHRCWVVGDMGNSDMLLARNAGCRSVLVLTGAGRGSLGPYRHTWADIPLQRIARDAFFAAYLILDDR